ncbi:MarR family winged helix-turn-helix transcriptional regulator [Paenibacillus mendelii]|uniref:MarR family winged helix-turn-helix transcriptional regulator n=1 Tax=Paenibacillus mendelii TaxID=206163 RepID=A0ABV6J4A3_9BACL|nr:MarR family winged helix-turn-helix transcriptional regulator [Paenibacillus mendelii]MCQ6561836.1 MarR family winged helix-turn-helix transcriptional regulator [Paenibacillus mendelii]
MNRKELLLSYAAKSLQHRRIWLAEWNRQNEMDLSYAQSEVLSWIDQKGPLQAKDLVNQFSVTSGGITAICDKLIARGLIHRIRNDQQDRRAIQLEITEQGREMVKTSQDVWDKVMENVFSVLTNAEIAMLDQIYAKLIESRS